MHRGLWRFEICSTQTEATWVASWFLFVWLLDAALFIELVAEDEKCLGGLLLLVGKPCATPIWINIPDILSGNAWKIRHLLVFLGIVSRPFLVPVPNCRWIHQANAAT